MVITLVCLFFIKIPGLVRDLNPGPLAPKARIIPLDQRATMLSSTLQTNTILFNSQQSTLT